MVRPVPFTSVSLQQLKSFWLFFSLAHSSPQVQIANMTRGHMSARETGLEQMFRRAALDSAGAQADECSPERGLVITLTPKWIISAIITGPKMNLFAALSHNGIKKNRCWKCLEGTEIKDYFVILGLLQAQMSCVLSCHPTLRVMRGLIFLWLGSFGSRASDREWALFNLGEWAVLELPGHSVSTYPAATWSWVVLMVIISCHAGFPRWRKKKYKRHWNNIFWCVLI